MVGGIRDAVLFGEFKLLFGFVAILVSALIVNVILGYFHPGFAGQPIAHTDGLWNALGRRRVLTRFTESSKVKQRSWQDLPALASHL